MRRGAATMPYLPLPCDDEQIRSWIVHVVLSGCAT